MEIELNIHALKFLESKIVIDHASLRQSTALADKRKRSYIISYPHFTAFFKGKTKLKLPDLVLGANFTYGWMPTAFVWKTNEFDEVLALLNAVKNDDLLVSKAEFTQIKNLINGSVVGTCKLLHFVNPRNYPIWDSKIKLLLTGTKKNTNLIDNYFIYWGEFQKIARSNVSKSITDSMSAKVGYEISFARAFETILFFSLADDYEASKEQTESSTSEKSIKVPNYKRDQFIFISNLSKYTANAKYPITYERGGYLLSEHYLTGTTRRLAKEVKARRNLLISDNGNYSRIKKIANEFDDEGLNIYTTAKNDIKNSGIISTETKTKRDELIKSIAAACTKSLNELDITEITTKQLSIYPDYMIGMEDFTIPVLMLCNLMHPIFDPQPKIVEPFQLKTSELYDQQQNGDFGSKEELQEVANFLVLHAYDYGSALQASKNTADKNLDGVAISYGGPMHSRRWIESLVVGDETEKFDEKLPEMYLVAQSLTLGIINGNPKPLAYHILGVGTPILIALIGYQLRHAKAVSIDSTAPFQDAFDGKIYGDKEAYVKMDMFRVAASHLIDGTPFKSTTPFFKFFEKKFPSDWDGLRNKLNILPTDNFKKVAKDLEDKTPELLEEFIPFFSKARAGNDELMQLVRICRSGHNYWILKRISDHIISKKDDPETLKKWIEFQVDRYTKTASPKWAKAVRLTFELTEKHRFA